MCVVRTPWARRGACGGANFVHVDRLSLPIPYPGGVALQWRLLDGSRASLALALLAAVGGPLAELPLMKLGAWHYLYLSLPTIRAARRVVLRPRHRQRMGGGWSAITGPCYFAVTTDAIALGRWFGSEDWFGSEESV